MSSPEGSPPIPPVDWDKVGFHGKPIASLSRTEIEAAFKEVYLLYKKAHTVNEQMREQLKATKASIPEAFVPFAPDATKGGVVNKEAFQSFTKENNHHE